GEGFDASGRSFMCSTLVGRGAQVGLSPATLAAYDDNIRTHLTAVNRGRRDPFTLKYFQYLALLFTEVVLDRLAQSPDQLLADLNTYVDDRNGRRSPGDP